MLKARRQDKTSTVKSQIVLLSAREKSPSYETRIGKSLTGDAKCDTVFIVVSKICLPKAKPAAAEWVYFARNKDNRAELLFNIGAPGKCGNIAKSCNMFCVEY